MTCPVAHPVRAADGLSFAPELEIIGGHGTEVWLRCRRCDAWFWTSTDVGGKYEHVGSVALPRRLAERALGDAELDAIAALVAIPQVPHGPVWTTASALVELFRALTPRVADAARADALRREGGPRWAGAAELLAAQARAAARAPARPGTYAVDVQLPGYELAGSYEVGAALLLVPAGRSELLRLDAAGLGRIQLTGPPRVVCARRGAVVVAIPTPRGDEHLVLDGNGQVTKLPPSPTDYSVASLDDGWWLYVPVGSEPTRWIELHRPDGAPCVKVARRFTAGAQGMPPPRRFAGGWMISNLVDDDGAVQALTQLGAGFETLAYSVGIDGERQVAPIDDDSFWASVEGVMERWVRRGRILERVDSFLQRASWLVGDRLISDTSAGVVTARAASGAISWTWKRRTTGATYGVATSAGVLLYDDVRAHLLDRDGVVVTTFAVEYPDVCVGSGGTVYMKSAADLWIVGDAADSIEVGPDRELRTTCGDAALLEVSGRCELVSRDGTRTAFDVPAGKVVMGTVGGPYVVEPGRVRAVGFGGP
jgi:hypothetical protein